MTWHGSWGAGRRAGCPPPEVPVGRANGLEHACVIGCDNIVTVPATALGAQLGYLLPAQEAALTAAIHAAFDLDWRARAAKLRRTVAAVSSGGASQISWLKISTSM